MSRSSRKKKSDEAGDEAYASELQDEEIARELQFEELNLYSSGEFDRGFDSSPFYQASSSASTSNNSRATYQAPTPGTVPTINSISDTGSSFLSLRL